MKTYLINSKATAFMKAIGFGEGESTQPIDPVQDPHIESNVKAFLKILNADTGKPLEQLWPKEAREVLIGLHSSVNVDVSGITVREKNITQDGQSITINIIKPASATPRYSYGFLLL